METEFVLKVTHRSGPLPDAADVDAMPHLIAEAAGEALTTEFGHGLEVAVKRL